jgi:hypothetical protein
MPTYSRYIGCREYLGGYIQVNPHRHNKYYIVIRVWRSQNISFVIDCSLNSERELELALHSYGTLMRALYTRDDILRLSSTSVISIMLKTLPRKYRAEREIKFSVLLL